MSDSTNHDGLVAGDAALDDAARNSAADEPQIGAESLDDPQLEQWLRDAYSAPPVPKSLLVRIDRAVTAEWGESPRLVDRPAVRWAGRLRDVMVRGSRLRRAVPIAGTVALLVVLGVVFSSSSPSYAWASVLAALERHGVVEVASETETRLLSLSEEVVSVRTVDGSRLIDLREGVQLERRSGATEMFRRPVSGLSGNVRDSLAVSFLVGGADGGDEPLGLRRARAIDEKWSTVSVSGTDRVDLRVTFEVADREPLTLSLMLDPETELPLACEVLDGVGKAQPVSLSYPSVSVAEVREREFPSGLAVVDLDAQGERLTASSDLKPEGHGGATGSGGDEAQDGTQVAANDRPLASADQPAAVAAAVAPTLFDAPSKWPVVEPVKARSTEIVEQVDALLTGLWKKNQITPAELADEEELLRRVYLDLAGRTPGVTEVREFLRDKSTNKYEAVVDRLLRSPDHASHLATVWRSFLIPEGVDLTAFGGVQEFDRWLADRFASDDSYDEVVRSLLLAEGRLSRSGPLLFYSAVKLDPEQLAARTSRVFLGMRLECAQCHDHPFEPWAQEEFWGFAAFFAQISRPQGDLENVSTVMRVRDVDRGDVMLPETETVVTPAFLNGAAIPESRRDRARRQQLADWLTSRENPYFARAAANRVWGQMFGKGIVDPIDDFGTQHTPVSPELLNLLGGYFVGTDFSLRELFRTVALSTAYRRSSGAATDDPRRLELFAQMNVKTLTAEQVYDCIAVATLLDSQGPMPDGFSLDRIANASRDQFIQQFKTPAGKSTEYLGGIPQALTLMNGTLISGATGLSTSGLLASLEAPFFSNEQRIEVLYLATLSRRPRPVEWELLQGYIADDATDAELREGLSDILWALLNSAEFTLNH